MQAQGEQANSKQKVAGRFGPRTVLLRDDSVTYCLTVSPIIQFDFQFSLTNEKKLGGRGNLFF